MLPPSAEPILAKQRQKCYKTSMPQAQQNSRLYFGSDMRPLFATLGLLLCLIATRVDELPMIKDSEAIHCIGKNVEVRGFVVSVRTSPLGTAIDQLRTRLPNQTFAGFIEAGAKIATDRWIGALAGKIIGISSKIELYQGKPQIKLCR